MLNLESEVRKEIEQEIVEIKKIIIRKCIEKIDRVEQRVDVDIENINRLKECVEKVETEIVTMEDIETLKVEFKSEYTDGIPFIEKIDVDSKIEFLNKKFEDKTPRGLIYVSACGGEGLGSW